MWHEAQKFEKDWWSDCTNTLGEELKQMEYAKCMGLKFASQKGKLVIKSDKSIIDIGGGPCSLLLKVETPKKKLTTDPLCFLGWVYDRYDSANVDQVVAKGEDLLEWIKLPEGRFDECWVYNCLQHTDNPRKIIENAKEIAKTIRIFEWLEIPTDEGHIHTLHKSELDYWLGKEGETKEFDTGLLSGLAYFNVVNYE
jgi:hypothetical protein